MLPGLHVRNTMKNKDFSKCKPPVFIFILKEGNSHEEHGVVSKKIG